MKLGVDVVPISPHKHGLKQRSNSFPSRPRLTFASRGLAGEHGAGQQPVLALLSQRDGAFSIPQAPDNKSQQLGRILQELRLPITYAPFYKRGDLPSVPPSSQQHAAPVPTHHPQQQGTGWQRAASSSLSRQADLQRDMEGGHGCLPHAHYPGTAPPTWLRRTSPSF